MKRLLLSLVILFSLVVPSLASYNPIRIEEQSASFDRYYQSVVTLRILLKGDKRGAAACMGTFIHRTWNNMGFILTAAHCVDNAEKINVHFYAGGDDVSEVRKAVKWKASDDVEDLALILIKNPPANAVPLDVADKYLASEHVDNPTFTVGRLTTELWDKLMSPLYAVPLSLPDIKITKSDYDSTYDKESSHITFMTALASPTNRPRAVCKGDSGGPIVAEINGVPHVIGVVSAITGSFRPTEDSMCGFVLLYRNVTFKLAWIDEVIRELQKK